MKTPISFSTELNNSILRLANDLGMEMSGSARDLAEACLERVQGEPSKELSALITTHGYTPVLRVAARLCVA